jgi:hypothetical protein
MRKSFIIIALIHMTMCIKAQSLTKNAEEAETFISNELYKRVLAKLNRKSVQNEYVRVFSVRFELNEKTEPYNIQLSGNMKDTVVINMVKSVLALSNKIWDIEQCKKHNPSLKFILPICIDISSANINLNKLADKSHEKFDFNSLIKFPPMDHELEISFRPSKEKFIGMVLNPILVNNAKPFE